MTKESLRLKVAKIIDRACQFDDFSGSIFEDEDPEGDEVRKYYLKQADRIIKLINRNRNE